MSANDIESRNAPLVSVVVPAHNHAAFIEDCLDSIAQSSYPRLEILVMDDGSSDDTFARASSWIQQNAHRVANAELFRQTNQGVTRTLNTLIARASGEYITAIASDDGLLPDGITVRVSALGRHPEWLAVFADCTVVDETGQLEAQSALHSLYRAHVPALMDPHRIARELILRWSVPGPVLLLRRAAFCRGNGSGVGPYDETLQVEDRDFYLRLLAINGLGFIPDSVAYYRLHQKNSITSPALRLRILRDVVAAENRHVTTFTGLNRCLLGVVAAHGSARLRFEERGGWTTRPWILVLKHLLKAIYALHVLASPPRKWR
jgi:glycosyltransferase involved in cell wall biosynthesis